MNLTNKSPLFEYYPPKNKYMGLISIPHSGTDQPKEFAPYLTHDPIALQQDVDFFVHELIDIPTLQAAGIGILKANVIRTCVDLNRSPETCVLNWKKNSRGIQVVINDPEQTESFKLRALYYEPYYEMLKALIYELISKSDSAASIVDLHSMPSKATAYHLQQKPDQKIERPDFCLSDQFGSSCQPEFIQSIQSDLQQHYNEVSINDPYKGGYITEFIDQSFPGVNNIQIEIKRGLYMDEEKFELLERHSSLKINLTQALLQLFQRFESSSS